MNDLNRGALKSIDFPTAGPARAGSEEFAARAAVGSATPAMDFEILVPIWGERYIRRFAELGLRSLLAAGNLPWLCRNHRVTVTILTTRDGAQQCKLWQGFTALARIAEMKFIGIDDLVAAYGRNYSVILTRAFNRAMALSESFLGRNFLYLVADQLFADGSLETVARAMAAGSDACLACTPRVEADFVAPMLATLGTAEELSLSCRDLVDLPLRFPHATLSAKTVRGETIHLSTAHQFFWRPAADTLVARCFLLHMLCIRPTHRPRDIAAPCDFSFVSALAPSGRYHFLDDSDHFVAVELQDSAHETEFITPFGLTPPEIAEAVSAWATAMHHQCIEPTFLFKGGASQYAATAAAALTQPYIDRLREHIAPPRDFRHHPFWLGATGAEILRVPAEKDAWWGDDVPPLLRRLVQERLEAFAPEGLDLAISVTDHPLSIDRMLARGARLAVRISSAIFYDKIEDVAAPGGRVLLVLTGGLADFVDLFAHRPRVQRLLRVAGPDRAILLSYRIAASDLTGARTRLDLHRLLTARLPVFGQFGLKAVVHDLMPAPLEHSPGFVIEVTPDSEAHARGEIPAWLDDPEDDPLYGKRGEHRLPGIRSRTLVARPDGLVLGPSAAPPRDQSTRDQSN